MTSLAIPKIPGDKNHFLYGDKAESLMHAHRHILVRQIRWHVATAKR